jgi:hypothetical protein
MRRLTFAGRLTSRAAFVLGLLLVVAVVFCGDEPVAVATPTAPSEPLKTTMHRLASALVFLTAPLPEVPSPESMQRESAALDALAEGALSLQQHLVKREPGFVYRARAIAEEARRIRWLSSRGRHRQARERLDHIVLTCVSCHSRLPSDDAAVLKGFVEQPHIRALPAYRAGPLLLAARQFEPGLTAYERALTSNETPARSLRSMLATYVSTAIRVQKNPERLETLVRFMQSRKDLDKQLRRDLDHWALSLEYVGPRLRTKGAPLAVARQLVHDGDIIRSKSKRRTGLAHPLRGGIGPAAARPRGAAWHEGGADDGPAGRGLLPSRDGRGRGRQRPGWRSRAGGVLFRCQHSPRAPGALGAGGARGAPRPWGPRRRR